jgi:AraC-like DNA-binding protein
LVLIRSLCGMVTDPSTTPASLSRDAGLPEDVMLRGDLGFLDIDEALQLGRHVGRVSGDPALGLHFGERAPLHALHLLGPLVMHATTLRAALRDLAKYLPLVLSPSTLTFDEGSSVEARGAAREQNKAHLFWSSPVDDADAARFMVECGFAFVSRLAQVFGGGRRALCALKLPYAEPEYVGEYERIFGCPIQFEAGGAALSFEPSVLDQAQPSASTHLYRLLREEADAFLDYGSAHAPVLAKVQRLLKSDPSLADGGYQGIARRLGTSARGLRRKLNREGTTLFALIEQARMDKASYLLSETEVPIKDIAERLGYSEPSAFHRAFKRWMGMTPRSFKLGMTTADTAAAASMLTHHKAASSLALR